MNRLHPVLITVILPLLIQAKTVVFQGHSFNVYVITEKGNRFAEFEKYNGTYLQVWKDAPYSIVIHNPLPVRAAVAVSIDGLNVIDAKRTSANKASKWIIKPKSNITLRGWQTGRSSLRRFVFTDQKESYAQWKGDRDRNDYTENLGVIGVAFFWNKAELRHKELSELKRRRPMIKKTPKALARRRSRPAPPATTAPARRASAESPYAGDEFDVIAEERTAKTVDKEVVRKKAGTGMGKRETNNVVDVDFRYDSGMYYLRDVVTLYYEFANGRVRKRIPSDQDRFTPEMPVK